MVGTGDDIYGSREVRTFVTVTLSVRYWYRCWIYHRLLSDFIGSVLLLVGYFVLKNVIVATPVSRLLVCVYLLNVDVDVTIALGDSMLPAQPGA